MRDKAVRARFGHCTRLLCVEDVGAGHHIQLMRLADHIDLKAVAHAGLLQILAEHAVDQADGREVLHAVKALRLQLLQVDVHHAEGVRAAHTGEHRCLFNDRQNLVAHFHHDLVRVAIGKQAGKGAAASHTETAGVIDDQHIHARFFRALGRNAGTGADADENLPLRNLRSEVR